MVSVHVKTNALPTPLLHELTFSVLACETPGLMGVFSMVAPLLSVCHLGDHRTITVNSGTPGMGTLARNQCWSEAAGELHGEPSEPQAALSHSLQLQLQSQ